MTRALTTTNLPKCERTGLILPLSRSLDWPDLDKHRAMVGVELEVIAKKVDRFGWDRDRGTLVHDRLVADWMDELEDYPLDEIKNACRAWLSKHSQKMPNEQDIKALIVSARAEMVAKYKASLPQRYSPRDRGTAEQRAQIAQSLGLAVHSLKRASRGDAE